MTSGDDAAKRQRRHLAVLSFCISLHFYVKIFFWEHDKKGVESRQMRGADSMKKVLSLLALCLTAAVIMGGCGSSSGAVSNKYITINKYDGLEVDAVEDSTVTDKTVDDYIESQLATLTTSKTEVPDRPIEKGDTILLDCQAADADGNVLDGTVLTDYELEIGSNSFIEGWEDACIGKPFGQEFTFDLQFPEGYGSEEISGKNATWTVTAKALVTGEEKAELTDENAKKLAAYDDLDVSTVDDYKKAVKEMLSEQYETNTHDTLEMEVWDAVMKETEVKKYPDGAVDKKVDSYLQTYKDMAEAYGMTFEDFLSQNGMDEEQVNKELTSAAEEAVKKELITELLLDELKIKISKDDYTKKYEEFAKKYGFSDVDSFLKEAGEDEAKELVDEAYVADWLIEHCKQVKKADDSEDEAEDNSDAEPAAEPAEEPAQGAESEAETENTEEQESDGETVQEDKAAGDSMKN